MTVVAVVERRTGDRVVIEAARRADELDADLHVVNVVGLGWLGNLELWLAERIGIPTGRGTIESHCRDVAREIAGPIVEEFTPVGIVGSGVRELLEYARSVDADCIVIDPRAGRRIDPFHLVRDPIDTLHASGIPVVEAV